MRRSLQLVVMLLAAGVAATAAARAVAGPAGAEPPHTLVDSRPVTQTGRMFALAAGGDLQAALDGARAGDTIVLPADATFKGPLTLPRVEGGGWIEIRSAAADELAAGRRVTPADAPKMAKIVGGDGSDAAVRTVAGAHHVRFVGIEFTVTPGAYNTSLLRFGTGEETREADLPHHLVIDRCWVHGDPARGGKRGLALNAAHVAVVDSYFSDWKGEGQETQAIAGWNGAGPFKITNNFVEAAGVNLMFGGSDAAIRDLVPSDIEIRGNHFFKPLAWRSERWNVKNLFELKNARRVLVAGNVFEHTWGQAQSGTAILISPRNQDGKAPWSGVEDVTFVDNVVRGAASGMKISGHDDSGPSRQTRRILIRNNVFENIDGRAWGGDGRLFTLLTGTDGVVIEHNTGLASGSAIAAEGPPHTSFVFRNNIISNGDYGIKASGVAAGDPTLRAVFPNATVEGNVFIGRSVTNYPPRNVVVSGMSDAGFTDPERRDWRLRPGSRFKGSAGGRDPGAAVETLPRVARKDDR
jgi:Right handed beta helix region